MPAAIAPSATRPRVRSAHRHEHADIPARAASSPAARCSSPEAAPSSSISPITATRRSTTRLAAQHRQRPRQSLRIRVVRIVDDRDAARADDFSPPRDRFQCGGALDDVRRAAHRSGWRPPRRQGCWRDSPFPPAAFESLLRRSAFGQSPPCRRRPGREPRARGRRPAARRRMSARGPRISRRGASRDRRLRWRRAESRGPRPPEFRPWLRQWRRRVPKNSRCAGPTLVQTRTSGSAIFTSALISPAWFIPSSSTPMSGFVPQLQQRQRKPDVVVQVPPVAKHRVTSRQKLGGDFLRRRLPRAAGDRHNGRARIAPHAARQRLQRRDRVGHDDQRRRRQPCRAGQRRGRSRSPPPRPCARPRRRKRCRRTDRRESRRTDRPPRASACRSKTRDHLAIASPDPATCRADRPPAIKQSGVSVSAPAPRARSPLRRTAAPGCRSPASSRALCRPAAPDRRARPS